MRLNRKLPPLYAGPAVRLADSDLIHAATPDGAPLCGDETRPRRRVDGAMAHQDAVCPACWQRWMRERHGVDIRNAWGEP